MPRLPPPATSTVKWASLAQLDVHPPGDRVGGSIPARSGNILSWRLIMKYFLVILSLQLIQNGELSVCDERISTSTG